MLKVCMILKIEMEVFRSVRIWNVVVCSVYCIKLSVGALSTYMTASRADIKPTSCKICYGAGINESFDTQGVSDVGLR
jgi:hypothetical protein